MTLTAGQHPVSLADVHAQMGPEALLRHLAVDHGRPVDRRLGAAVAQQMHRNVHGTTS